MAWVLTGFGLGIPFSPPFLGLTKIVAFALTTLWLGHLLAHAIKVSAAARLRQQGINDARVVSRRNTLPIFTRALAMAALATSLPTLAFADCDQATAQCEAAAANCRANCDRAFHREEVDQACHQEGVILVTPHAKLKPDAHKPRFIDPLTTILARSYGQTGPGAGAAWAVRDRGGHEGMTRRSAAPTGKQRVKGRRGGFQKEA